jgi:demethylmenaquinone methyltransferase/2-methoxy-6-polyprenyl-1,4-benzoquinol methylase
MANNLQDIQQLKTESWRLFNDISPRYDLLNRLLSFGLDIHWRNCLAKYLPTHGKLHILDCATGTGDVLLRLFKNSQHIQSAVGIDLAEKMMEIGRRKIESVGLSKHIKLQTGDAMMIPSADNTFDATTMAFGIRNTPNPQNVLNEMHRVLKKGGRALILEFSLPQNPIIRFFHLTHLRYIVPLIGGLFTGHFQAYQYLNQTIELFPYGNQFINMMQQSGFSRVQAHTLLFGTATIYQGDKT